MKKTLISALALGALSLNIAHAQFATGGTPSSGNYYSNSATKISIGSGAATGETFEVKGTTKLGYGTYGSSSYSRFYISDEAYDGMQFNGASDGLSFSSAINVDGISFSGAGKSFITDGLNITLNSSSANELHSIGTYGTNSSLLFKTVNTERMRITGGGQVGIRTNSPAADLHIDDAGRSSGDKLLMVGDDTYFTDLDVGNILGLYGNYNIDRAGLKLGSGGSLLYGISSKLGINTTDPKQTLHVNGKTLIGTLEPTNFSSTYQLAVDGKIVARSLNITPSWADYVFDKNYKLKSLDSVAVFIQKNHRLPDVPSAKEVEEKGVDAGDMLRLQMQKIEELTLYLLEIKKENEKLKNDIEDLKNQK